MNAPHAKRLHAIIPLVGATLMMSAALPVSAEEPAADADVLLRDSFEEGNQAPENWKQGTSIPGVKYVYDRTEASDGKRSLSLQKSANRFFPIAAWTRTVAHTGTKPALHLSAKVKAEQARKAILDVVFVDDSGKWISHEWIAYIGQKEESDPPANHDWKEYKGAVEIPAGTKQFVIGLQIYGPGKVWFDELEARYADSADGDVSNDPASTSRTQERSEDLVEPEPIVVRLDGNLSGSYLLVEPKPGQSPPDGGCLLLIVLPGGTGSADFHPFVRQIQEKALEGRFVVAQPLAPSYVVWPTRDSIARPSVTTEELITAVIDDVAARQHIDRSKVYLLAWSSGGPAAYAALLQDGSPIAGALIAMSVFKPDQLPPLENARGRSVYLLHSPDDRVCPYWMAEAAEQQLAASGVRVTLVDYDGGHGWHGPVFDQIRSGIDWLQRE